MGDVAETELIGVTFPKTWLLKIDEIIKGNPLENRQDFIRKAVQEKLKETEASA
jgi:metal-responsive CopG/Arc/MetJ family transcriptional regulator